MSRYRFYCSPTRRQALLATLPVCILLPARAASSPLNVACASSAADVLRELAAAFVAAHAGLQVPLAVGASGLLLDRLAQGEAFDVLVCADTDTAARGVDRRLLRADSVRSVAVNTLVLAVPAASTLPLRRLTDLAQADVLRIAMGRTASVPAGRAARQAIDAARLWPSVQRKIVWADDARQAADLVLRGDVDAGFLYGTDAQAAGPALRVVESLRGHAPLRLTAAVAQASRQAELATAFVQFLRGDAARAAFTQRGFSAP